MLNIAIPTKTQLTTSFIEPQKDQSMTKDRMRLKYGFINESKKLLDKLPQSMRYVGKPELLIFWIFRAEHHIIDPGVPVHL